MQSSKGFARPVLTSLDEYILDKVTTRPGKAIDEGCACFRSQFSQSSLLVRATVNTENRVQQLCREALAAKPEDNVDRILEELRVALQEHVSLAKEKLREQVNSFALQEWRL
jgi:hypothetical protein